MEPQQPPERSSHLSPWHCGIRLHAVVPMTRNTPTPTHTHIPVVDRAKRRSVDRRGGGLIPSGGGWGSAIAAQPCLGCFGRAGVMLGAVPSSYRAQLRLHGTHNLPNSASMAPTSILDTGASYGSKNR